MQYARVCLLSFLVLFWVPGGAVEASPLQYELSLVASSGDVIEGRPLISLGDGPAINDSGLVAAVGYAAYDDSGSFLFTQQGTVARSGQVIDGHTLGFINIRAAMNNAGEVVFYSRTVPENVFHMFTQHGHVAGPGSVIDGRTLWSVWDQVSINASGQIAFRASVVSDGGNTLAHLTREGLIAAVGDEIDGKILATLSSPPTINDAGQTVFVAHWEGEHANDCAVFSPPRMLVNRHDVIDGVTIYDLYTRAAPVINNRGEVIFQTLNPGRLFTLDELLVDRWDTIAGRIIQDFYPVSDLNDAGTVAFRATFVNEEDFSEGEGIFTQYGLVAELGDAVEGRTLRGFSRVSPYPRLQLSNSGQIAFWAQFADDSEGIVLATPIPEPSAVALLGAGLLGLAACRRRKRRRRPGAVRGAVLILAACGTAASALPALAQAEVYWDAGGSAPPHGTFNVAANWSPDRVPGPSDVAVFDRHGTYTVTFDNSPTTDWFKVLAGDVTFTASAPEHTYRVVDDASVDADLTISAQRAIVQDDFFIGFEGTGTLKICNGAKVLDSSGLIGFGVGAVGTAAVEGPGSTWTNLASMGIGSWGRGTLNVRNGGKVVSDRADFATANTGTRGTATVDGPGSSWTTQKLEVGMRGSGILNVHNGAEVSSATGYLGSYPGAKGTVNLEGAGSTWTNSGTISVGGYAMSGGTGIVSIGDGSLVDVGWSLHLYSGGTVTLDGGTLIARQIDNTSGGTFDFQDGRLAVEEYSGELVNHGGTIAPGPSCGLTTVDGGLRINAGSLEIELGGLDQYDRIDVAQTARLAGALDVRLIDGFVPRPGDEFTVMTFGSRLGDFAQYRGLDLGGGLWLRPDWSARSLVLTAVPEPSALPLLATGALGLLARAWRKRRS